jgi:hypothetical protein
VKGRRQGETIVMIRKEEWRKGRVEIKELREEILKEGRKKKEEKVQIFT